MPYGLSLLLEMEVDSSQLMGQMGQMGQMDRMARVKLRATKARKYPPHLQGAIGLGD